MYCLDKSKFNALLVRIIGFLCGLAGVILSLAVKTSAIGPVNGVESLVYFTVISSIFITIFFGVLAVMTIIDMKKNGENGKSASLNKVLHLVVMINSLFSFLVFWTILSWSSVKDPTYFLSASNILLHLFLPILCFVDWLLYMPHGGLKYKYAPFTLIFPLIYLIVLIIRAQVAPLGEPTLFKGRWIINTYPYSFLQPEIMGNAFIPILICLLFGVAIAGLSILAVSIDKKLFKKLEYDEYLKP